MAGMIWYQPVGSINSVAIFMNIGNRCLCTEDYDVEHLFNNAQQGCTYNVINIPLCERKYVLEQSAMECWISHSISIICLPNLCKQLIV